jgi:hypothetical protein
VEKLIADHGFSERRACGLIGGNRSAWHYESLRGQGDAARERMREIANQRRRFDYRRLAIVLKREGKRHEPEEGLPAVTRGAVDSAQTWWSQARAWDAGADSDPKGSQPALVA